MAFKKKTMSTPVPDSPDKLLLEFPRRKIPDVLPHQREVMRAYASQYTKVSDVALQLPTGSGKTLVGLLIAEWRRRKYNERVVYLCPTKQLVNQTVEQGEEKYGLTTLGFTGQIREYEPSLKAEYRNVDRVAVTTYSGLFNTHTFFTDADIVIVDDAHAAESYIASMWSLSVERTNPEHKALHAALAGVLKPLLDSTNFARLNGDSRSLSDHFWVDKIATPDFVEKADEIASIISAHVKGITLAYPWSMLCDHLYGCQLYLSTQNILLRPLIPPTWTHEPFSRPKQRIFMSATLGPGGDLERLTGREKIERLSIPEGWERQGVGRRFFMFPSMSLNENELTDLRRRLMTEVERSLVLVPNQFMSKEVAKDVEEQLGLQVFRADDIESSKKTFVESKGAVAVIANRYDGIDFPGSECRLMFIDGLPKATNIQERFLMTRMAANVLFNARIQTRVIQAVGRCTRSLEDYSAVIVTGEELPDYLTDSRKRKYLHPEFQAEISFGVDQSKGMSIDDFIENFNIFIENGKEWEEVNKEIVAERDRAEQESFPVIDELGTVVSNEIIYQMRLWNADYEAALAAAERVLSGLKAPELKGYRALWHYLAGSAAWLGAKAGVSSLEPKARMHYDHAKNATNGIPWLVALARFQPADKTAEDAQHSALLVQIEQVEMVLARLGIIHDGKFAEREKKILEGLLSKDKGFFEEAHKLLGELLGFKAGKIEEDGSPDPWWISEKICFVFEDHQGGEATSSLGAEKARQASSHPNWIKKNLKDSEGLEIIPVLVTPVAKANKGAIPHLDTVFLWPLDEFREWAKSAIATVREIRTTFAEPGDLEWRAMAAKKFEDNGLDAYSIAKKLKASKASDILKV